MNFFLKDKSNKFILYFCSIFYRNFWKKFLVIFFYIGINSTFADEEYGNKSSLKNISKFYSKNESKELIKHKVNTWENFDQEKNVQKSPIWRKISEEDYILQNKEAKDLSNLFPLNKYEIGTHNRSIVFDDYSSIGPDINWLVPPGFRWNNKYKFDASVRGHNRRKSGESFLGWNGGDAVGQFHYQFLNNKNYSFGINYGMRSVYSGSAAGGASPIGEGTSLGFRTDYKISSTAGFAFGAEQLLHFDGKTDTGRDIYLTLSKAFWQKNLEGQFPLRIFTFGIGTGKMAEGNIKGLCSDLLGGSGTETAHQRRLCWAPVFSIAKVYNKKFSTFFEYNSKFFLIGSSIAPIEDIPLRGTFAVQLSDHINNYKLNTAKELKWVFRISYAL